MWTVDKPFTYQNWYNIPNFSRISKTYWPPATFHLSFLKLQPWREGLKTAIIVSDVKSLARLPSRFGAFIIKYQTLLVSQSTIDVLWVFLSDQPKGPKHKKALARSVTLRNLRNQYCEHKLRPLTSPLLTSSYVLIRGDSDQSQRPLKGCVHRKVNKA